MKLIRTAIIASLLLVMAGATAFADQWKPVPGILTSKFTKDVNPAAPHQEYPRPQLERRQWLNLNGLWDYAIAPVAEEKCPAAQGKILVPFAIESALSGVGKTVGEENNLWYRHTFAVPSEWKGQNVRLNFGAVDWKCEVFINGQKAGGHQGGYTPFSLDITKLLKNNGKEELVVKVWDPTDKGPQPIGKQTVNPRGIWYTSVTGIWQTVWLEPVADAFIEKVLPVASLNVTGGDAIKMKSGKSENQKSLNEHAKDIVRFDVSVCGAKAGDSVRISGTFEGKKTELVFPANAQKENMICFPKGVLKYWTPETPVLYPVKVELLRDGKAIDTASSYFAVRKISLGKTKDGILRLMLNDQFVFQHGPLDQGWWPDGLYTAPTDKALAYDVVMLKKFGFNMLRKHVKVEPARFYYHCDKLGMLVWQDMPSGEPSLYIRWSQPDAIRSPESVAIYKSEYKELINTFAVYPSIVMWVPFNEGWGQFDTPAIVKWTREMDPTRLVNNTSGWTDRLCGDVYDTHAYPGPAMTCPELHRAVVLGEYGGLGLPVKGHSWNEKGKNWGYVKFNDKEALFNRYEELNQKLRPMILKGLSAAVYTQTTDVEIEVNGLMSYDREVIKMPEAKLFATNTNLRRAIDDAEQAKAFAASAWNGYNQYDIQFFYKKAKVVYPKKAAPGNPWMWRARFWGHEPQTDLALLEKGYHLVYLDTVPELGSPASVYLWQEFYNYLTQNLGLSKKANLEGMSRGGLYLMNWAIAYPEQVASIYIDNPVLDARSWPGSITGGKPRSPNDWANVLKSYKLTEESVKTFKGFPVDTCDVLAKKKVPIILVNGDSDTVVPFNENGKILKEKYEKLGGPIKVIMKPGADHHPHSLKDPKPIVDFILKYN